MSEETVDEGRGIRLLTGITAIGMGIVIAIVGAWAGAGIGVTWPAFGVGLVGGTWFTYRQSIPSAALGSGLYITALLLLLVPITIYIPSILSSTTKEGATFVGAFTGSVLGLFVWGFAFAVAALVTAAIGYFAKKRARKNLKANR